MPIKKNKVSYKLDLESLFDDAGVEKNRTKRKALSELVGVTLIDEVVSYLDKGVTPVSNGTYKRSLTSKEYKAKKIKEGKSSFADMQLTESMLNNLSIKATSKDVELKITDSTEKKKAFNHNKGDTLPQRQWLPDDSGNEKFKRGIIKKIKDIIKDGN